MCYAVYLSTDSAEDLSVHNSKLLHLSREPKPSPRIPGVDRLRYDHIWHVGTVSGCSCTLRHSTATNSEFVEPSEWEYEDEWESIAATHELYELITYLKSHGYRIDCLNTWEGERYPNESQAISLYRIKLTDVSKTHFRLFEYHHFLFS